MAAVHVVVDSEQGEDNLTGFLLYRSARLNREALQAKNKPQGVPVKKAKMPRKPVDAGLADEDDLEDFVIGDSHRRRQGK